MKSSTDFATEKFIYEVESRPALWDLACKDYANKDKKKKCWDELVELFVGTDIMTESEKDKCAKLLQRKWKSLRDCYSRELQRMAKVKSGSPTLRKSPYVYFNQLSFLKTVVKHKDATCVANEENREEELAPHPSTSSEQIFDSRKRKSLRSIEQTLLEVLDKRIKMKEEQEKLAEEDEDRMFLLSLLKPVKKVPEHLRLSVRMELMQVIERAQQS